MVAIGWILCWLDPNRYVLKISLVINIVPLNLMLYFALGFIIPSNSFGLILERILHNIN